MKTALLITAMAGGWNMLSTTEDHQFDMLETVTEQSTHAKAAGAAEEAHVAQAASSKKPLRRRLLVYTASWCGPCRTFKAVALPRLVSVGWRVGDGPRDHISFIECDACLPAGITALPTFVLLEDGREISRHVGALDEWGVGELVKGYSERPPTPTARISRK
jgi:thiol-disulfide isomerase/thioredoxin